MITTRPVSDADWPAVAAGFRDLTFEQSLTYGRAAAGRIGAQVRCVVLEAEGTPIAAAQLRIKRVPGLQRGIAWVPSGPLVHPVAGTAPDADRLQAIFGALRDQFARRDGHVLRLRLPGIGCHDPAAVAAIAARTGYAPTRRAPAYRSFAIDLSQSPDTLLQKLNGKWRTDLRFALKSGLTLDRGTGPDLIRRFMALFETVQAAKGFHPEISPGFHFALAGPDYALEILIVTRDGQDLAGIVVGTAGRTATYLFGATGDAGRPLRAGYFLQWQAITLAQTRGQDWYDLGGIDFDTNPEVSRFKERMGGVAIAADVYETDAGGVFPAVVAGLETLRARMKRRG